MLKLVGVVVLTLVIFSMSANAEVYKWKDKDGVTRYSDNYPEGNIPYQPLKAKKPANGTVIAPSGSKEANKVSTSSADDTGKPLDQKEAQRKVKEKACANAKDNLQKLKQGGIVYKENAKGEREYLDETSMKNETVAAEKEVAAACN